MKKRKNHKKFGDDRKGPCTRCGDPLPSLIIGGSCANCGFLAKRFRKRSRA